MKKYFLFSLFLILACAIGSPRFAFAQQVAQGNKPQSMQDLINSAYQDMQKSAPQAAQAFMNAVQQGDVAGAKKIYKDFQDKQTSQLTSSSTVTSSSTGTSQQPSQQPAPPQTSSIEQTLSGKFTEVQTAPMTQFGYDLFNKQTSPFLPPATIPVGPDYMIGPGDQFTLTLWGTTEGIFTLQVTNEGNITLPKVGVVAVAGLRFGELEKTLRSHLAAYYRDVSLSVAMGNLRTMTVYVVGQVQNPGSYSVPSLTTVYGALFAAGGPAKKGTMRSIEVLRHGKVIRTIDLYDFLLRGDRSQDMKLQSEDTVFVPLIGPVVGVAGAVYRPAIYEMKGQETMGDVIKTAGGIMPTALGGRMQLDRFVDNQKQVLFDIKISSLAPEKLKDVPELRKKVDNMDVLKIFPLNSEVWEDVYLQGAVKYPGKYQWKPSLRIKDLIMLGELHPKADMKRAEIIRLANNDSAADITGDMGSAANTSTAGANNAGNDMNAILDSNQIDALRVIIPVDLAALMSGDEKQNILLRPKDIVQVYSVDQNPDNMWETVSLAGNVRHEGKFLWKKGLKIKELILQGQILPATDLQRGEIVRLSPDFRDRLVIPFNIEALMKGDESQDVALQPMDQVRVFSALRNAEKVTLSGEVMRTGTFEIKQGERLSDVLRRAGGFTPNAYPYGAVFKRPEIKTFQAKQLNTFIVSMQERLLQSSAESQAAAVSTEEAGIQKAQMLVTQQLLANLKAQQDLAEGRVALNITKDIPSWAGTKDDPVLQDGDTLLVPKEPQEVTVIGEVYNPGAVTYHEGMKVKDYIGLTGGYSQYANKDDVFIMQANGLAQSNETLAHGSVEDQKLKPGDAVMVPQEVERHAAMRNFKDVIDILFKTAVIVATLAVLHL